MFHRYYTFRISDSLAHIAISLSLEQGDADLYVSTYKSDSPDTVTGEEFRDGRGEVSLPLSLSSSLTLPTKSSYTWKSIHFGDDVVQISYDDPHFCSDCNYIVGVYGYINSTYSLLISSSDDMVAQLLPNHPLEVVAAVGAVKYFNIGVLNSADSILFVVTPLDSGRENLFVQAYVNDSVLSSPRMLPNPEDPSTYTYTTKGVPVDYISVKGPHVQGTVFVVAVQTTKGQIKNINQDEKHLATATATITAGVSIRYSILASYSQQYVTLTAGVPQNHFVSKGTTEYFRFIPEGDTDMRVTLTARSGDPDLLISSDFDHPYCTVDNLAPRFYNYTWISNKFGSDQIIISRDLPCESVLPSTSVDLSTCTSSSYQPASHKPLNIGVYGYLKSTVFSILATPVGARSQLTDGVSMLSTLSSSYECSDRDDDSGECLPSSAVKNQVLAGYFSFVIIPTFGAESGLRASGGSGQAVIFTVVPTCNTSSSSSFDVNRKVLLYHE